MVSHSPTRVAPTDKEGNVTGQAHHIELNLGNVFAVGFLSLLFYGAATWGSNYFARKNVPIVSYLSVGAQNYLHAA